MSNKGIKMKDKNGNAFYPCPYYPVGSTFKTSVNENPSRWFGGTWSLLQHDYDIIHTGSQILWDYWDFGGNTGDVGKTAILGAYDDSMYDEVFAGVPMPNGYHKEIRLTCQQQSDGSAKAKIYFNSTLMIDNLGTWSSDSFRTIGHSAMMKLNFGREPVFSYSGTGVLLYVSKTSGSIVRIRDITVHGYYVSDVPFYVWRRTA